MIKAEVHSDDHKVKADFDAQPWFEQASDEEIMDLAACGWEGDEPADAVATWTNDKGDDENVVLVFDHIENMSNSRGAVGFECQVDEESAREWLEINKSDLLEDIDENQRKGSW